MASPSSQTDTCRKLQIDFGWNPLRSNAAEACSGPEHQQMPPPPPARHGCLGREGASEAAPEAVRQAVGGGRQSGWGRFLSVTNAIEAGTWRPSGGQWRGVGWTPRKGGGRAYALIPYKQSLSVTGTPVHTTKALVGAGPPRPRHGHRPRRGRPRHGAEHRPRRAPPPPPPAVLRAHL